MTRAGTLGQERGAGEAESWADAALVEGGGVIGVSHLAGDAARTGDITR